MGTEGPHRNPHVTGVVLYGALPPTDDIWPPPDFPVPFTPTPTPGTGALPPFVFAPTAEQVASALMQRLEPALAEIHDRLDKIERRLPVTAEERVELEKARKAAMDLQEGIQKLLAEHGGGQEAPASKAVSASKKKR